MNLNELDITEIGIWPWPFKAVVIILAFVLVVGAGYWFDWTNKTEEIDRLRSQHQELRSEFEVKQRRAAALDDYREQLEEMRESFGNLLRQLPSRVEVAGLLVDISQTGLSAGLEFDLFRPQGTQEQEFYAQMPINIEVRGDYHEFGRFVSGVANLPRIVTLHDVQIQSGNGDGDDELTMAATARTYWYLGDDNAGGGADGDDK